MAEFDAVAALRRLKLNRWLKISLGVVGLILVGCGSKSSTTTTPAPTATATNPTTITTTGASGNPALADLSNASAITLVDKVNYTGLSDLAGLISLPIVSDPVILMSYDNTRSTSFTNNLKIEFEDSLGAWEGIWTSFPGAATRSTTSFNAIHSNSSVTVRVVAALSGDAMTGVIYYRLRQSGDNECEQIVVTCTPANSPSCPSAPDPAPACISYMSNPSTNSLIKELGTFTASYSAWATLGN